MDLELTDKEKCELLLVLENMIPGIENEIGFCTQHDWKKKLLQDKMLLKRILVKLKNERPDT